MSHKCIQLFVLQSKAGLTGRIIIADTYEGWEAHDGVVFPGKDPSKADHSAAYAAHWIAQYLVKADLCKKSIDPGKSNCENDTPSRNSALRVVAPAEHILPPQHHFSFRKEFLIPEWRIQEVPLGVTLLGSPMRKAKDTGQEGLETRTVFSRSSISPTLLPFLV